MGEWSIIVVSGDEAGKLDGVDRIDELGELSGKAQGLRRAITRCATLSRVERLYLYKSERILGYLKVGVKHLYYWRKDGTTLQVDPLCVLDFYVETQRVGIGKALFDYMLNAEAKSPGALAYDRPSPKLLPFLRKHYGLNAFLPQPNNFIIFDAFFSNQQQ